MANVKISQLSSAAALTGTEEIPVVQDNATVKTTVQDIANLAGGGSTLDVVTVGTFGSSPVNVSFSSVATLNPTEGTQNAVVTSYPTITLSAGMGSTPTLSSISFPTLTLGTISIQQFSNLTSISLPALTTIISGMMGGGLAIGNNSSLTTVDISSLVNLPTNPYFGWYGCAFSEATVDHILERMVATGATNGNLQLDQGTSSAPSSAGLANITILQGRNWAVTTN